MPSFTQRLSNLEDIGPVIEITLTPSFPFINAMEAGFAANRQTKVLALIDTGASGTVISQDIAEVLQISPVGRTMINTPSSTNVDCLQFDVQLVFPNQVIIQSIVVTEAPLQNQPVQCLVGRDVLKHGVLIYTGYDN